MVGLNFVLLDLIDFVFDFEWWCLCWLGGVLGVGGEVWYVWWVVEYWEVEFFV